MDIRRGQWFSRMQKTHPCGLPPFLICCLFVHPGPRALDPRMGFDTPQEGSEVGGVEICITRILFSNPLFGIHYITYRHRRIWEYLHAVVMSKLELCRTYYGLFSHLCLPELNLVESSWMSTVLTER